MNKLAGKSEDKIFDIINYSVTAIMLAVVIYPLLFIVIASISDPDLVNQGKVWIIPRGVTFEGYARLYRDPGVWNGYRNSLFYAIVGTTINVSLTLTGAYSLSRKDFIGRKFFMIMITFTMFFSGGLIPTFIIVKNLGMYNSVWAMLIPNAVSAWNLIIARTYFQNSIPQEMLEASCIDGCSNTKFFFKILLPLSAPIIAVLVIFYGVFHWNSYFNALIYLRNDDLYPLQIILRNILILNQVQAMSAAQDADSVAELQRIAEVIKFAIIIVACLPVLILYPFLQKYFVKGIMIGAIKG